MQLIIARTELQENSIKRIFEIMMKLKSRATTKQTLPSFFLSSANSQISVFSSSLTCHCSISYKLEPSSKTTLQNHTLILQCITHSLTTSGFFFKSSNASQSLTTSITKTRFFFQGKNAISNATNEKHGCMRMTHS